MSEQDKNTIYDFLNKKNDLLHGSQDDLIRDQIKPKGTERLIFLHEGKENRTFELKTNKRFPSAPHLTQTYY